jgi:hypothetical protein
MRGEEEGYEFSRRVWDRPVSLDVSFHLNHDGYVLSIFRLDCGHSSELVLCLYPVPMRETFGRADSRDSVAHPT